MEVHISANNLFKLRLSKIISSNGSPTDSSTNSPALIPGAHAFFVARKSKFGGDRDEGGVRIRVAGPEGDVHLADVYETDGHLRTRRATPALIARALITSWGT